MRLAVCILSLVVSSCAAEPAVPVDAVSVRVVAQRTTWHASYILAGPERHSIEVATGREIHVPLGASVTIALASGEYIADFAMPALGVHDFAAPGLPSMVHFRASRAGRYDVRSGELCGLPHDDRSRGTLIVEAAGAYRAWLRTRART